MPKNKMVTKPCPKCKQQVPVACKACPCGHVFFVARRAVSIHKIGARRGSDEGGEGDREIKRRRTERIRRERPNYFNALQIENQLKSFQRKSRQRTGNSTSSSANDLEGEGSNSEEGGTVASKKRGRPKGSKGLDKGDIKSVEKEEDMFANISAEKALQYSVILAEINRKFCAQQFKV
ncbi:UPF0547 protein C16orf87 homolog [Centruroides vittatus]|uniref:UPF0547 protein C16orf87 homolog n=1 Tax=Centruroides sculpturatus TaxID=218467 RepID=UPI000C6CA282|nr:UPF0547 protein C16orf87 homolog [Centruroides sculpturatus]